MMKNKKLVTIALTTAFTATLMVPAFADEITTGPAAAEAQPILISSQVQAMNVVTSLGTVQEISQADGYQRMLVKTDQTEIEFHINGATDSKSGTWLVNANGLPASLEDLQGKEVVVAHEAAMTKSIPAQCNAVAVFERGDVTPNYAVVEAVSSNADGSITLTTDNGGRLVTVDVDATTTPFRTRNIVTPQDLKTGDEVVLYYDILALSYPGQAHASKVVLLQSADATVDDGGVDQPVVEAVSDMVPVRDIANELGMAVQWNQESQTVVLTKDAFSATITIGSVDCGINKMRVQLQQAAEIRDGRTYVPQQLVQELRDQLNA